MIDLLEMRRITPSSKNPVSPELVPENLIFPSQIPQIDKRGYLMKINELVAN